MVRSAMQYVVNLRKKSPLQSLKRVFILVLKVKKKLICLYRGYYMAARGYEFYLRVRPCNVLFILFIQMKFQKNRPRA